MFGSALALHKPHWPHMQYDPDRMASITKTAKGAKSWLEFMVVTQLLVGTPLNREVVSMIDKLAHHSALCSVRLVRSTTHQAQSRSKLGTMHGVERY